MNSHIQMPKGILKNFVNEYDTFCYYDVKKGYISKKGTPRSTNVQKDYYSDEIEKKLNIEIEQPMVNLISKIKKMQNGEILTLNNNVRNTIYRYTLSLILRDQNSFKIVAKESKVAFLLPEQEQRNLCIYCGLNSKNKTELETEYSITIIFNKTKIPFVLPIFGLYPIENKGRIYYICPITPKIAITLVQNEYYNELINEDNTLNTLEVDDEKTISRMNLRAFDEQCNREWGVVVSNQKEQLIQLNKLHLELHNKKESR